MEIYTNAFNQACPVKSIKTPKRYIKKREPWVTNGILTSSLTKSKLLKKKLKKPTEQNSNAFKKYCIIFDKVKKMVKESYFNLELELNKNNLKKKLGKYCVKLYINKTIALPFLIHLS